MKKVFAVEECDMMDECLERIKAEGYCGQIEIPLKWE